VAKYEYFDTVTGVFGGIEGNDWYAQTFKCSTAHYINKVRLYIYGEAALSGITVSIRATTAGKPSGSDLATGTLTGASIGATRANTPVNLFISIIRPKNNRIGGISSN